MDHPLRLFLGLPRTADPAGQRSAGENLGVPAGLIQDLIDFKKKKNLERMCCVVTVVEVYPERGCDSSSVLLLHRLTSTFSLSLSLSGWPVAYSVVMAAAVCLRP